MPLACPQQVVGGMTKSNRNYVRKQLLNLEHMQLFQVLHNFFPTSILSAFIAI